MKKEVSLWIDSGKDLQAGIGLLDHFGVKTLPGVDKYRNSGSNGYWADYVYQKLVSLPDDVAPKRVETVAATKSQIIITRSIVSSELKQEQIALEKQNDLAHSDLRHAETDDERLEHAKRIMEEIIPEKKRVGMQIVGVHKAEVVVAPVEEPHKPKILTAEDVRKMQSIRVQISKLRAKIKAGGSPDVWIREQRLIEYENELKKYE